MGLLPRLTSVIGRGRCGGEGEWPRLGQAASLAGPRGGIVRPPSGVFEKATNPCSNRVVARIQPVSALPCSPLSDVRSRGHSQSTPPDRTCMPLPPPLSFPVPPRIGGR